MSRTEVITGLLIDPETQTVAEVQVRRNPHGDTCLDHMRELIEARWIDIVRDGLDLLPGNPADDIWVNDAFGADYPWQLPEWSYPIYGKALVLSYDDAGSSVSHTLTPEAVDILRNAIIWGEANAQKNTSFDAACARAHE